MTLSSLLKRWTSENDLLFNILQSTEVKNSNAMELESLKRQLKFLEDNKVEVTKLVTDRHIQVSAYMANEKSGIEHAYDVWHVAKGIKL